MPDSPGLPATVALTTSGLRDVAASLAAQAPLWLAVAADRSVRSADTSPARPVRVSDPGEPDSGDSPWGTRIASGDGWEAWLHTWEHGQVGEVHAHDGRGAIAVLTGSLLEDVPGGAGAVLEPGQVHAFAAGHRHGLAALAGPAVSVHVVARAFSHAQPLLPRPADDDIRPPAGHEAPRSAARTTRPTRPTRPQRRSAASPRSSR